MIEINHLRKEYGNLTPLKDINLKINNGDIVTFIGPSGTGKTTLLRCINRLETPTSGEIIIDGENTSVPGYNLNKMRMKIGMVFQSFNLYEHLTVLENVMFAQIKLLKKSKQEAYEKAIELLNKVGMSGHLFHYNSQLSGGQRQRAAIARTLALDPEILLLDEPTSALDPLMVDEVKSVIFSLKKLGIIMLIVTHDMDFARKISSRIVFLSDGEVYDDGTPEQIIVNPQKELTRKFIQRITSKEIIIPYGKYDYLNTISDILNYCSSKNLDRKMIYKVQSVFEELVENILHERLSENGQIKVVLEFSDMTESIKMTITHTIENFILQNCENRLALTIINSNATSVEEKTEQNTIVLNFIW